MDGCAVAQIGHDRVTTLRQVADRTGASKFHLIRRMRPRLLLARAMGGHGGPVTAILRGC